MRSQLRLNFPASQAEHGIDDIITIIFLEPGKILLSVGGPTAKLISNRFAFSLIRGIREGEHRMLRD